MPMTKKPDYQKQRDNADTSSRGRRARKTVWDDAEIVVNIECTKPGTALDDYLRKEQTRALLDLLADYEQRLDKNGDAES
jgi:hypothetical protein